MVKIDMATGQWRNVAPNFGADSTKYRQARDFWKRFDPFDQNAMYVGYQCILVTRDGAQTWRAVSPDLTTGERREAGGVRHACSACLRSDTRRARRFRDYDFFLSAAKKGVVWTGSNNGQIYTRWTRGCTGPTSATSPTHRQAPHSAAARSTADITTR